MMQNLGNNFKVVEDIRNKQLYTCRRNRSKVKDTIYTLELISQQCTGFSVVSTKQEGDRVVYNQSRFKINDSELSKYYRIMATVSSL